MAKTANKKIGNDLKDYFNLTFVVCRTRTAEKRAETANFMALLHFSFCKATFYAPGILLFLPFALVMLLLFIGNKRQSMNRCQNGLFSIKPANRVPSTFQLSMKQASAERENIQFHLKQQYCHLSTCTTMKRHTIVNTIFFFIDIQPIFISCAQCNIHCY